jgi:hypothetical protein
VLKLGLLSFEESTSKSQGLKRKRLMNSKLNVDDLGIFVGGDEI